jgi:1-acyl-sn-glycerol-3-phosphate acyltransferase
MLGRRCLTISLFVALTGLATALLPVLLIAALLLSLLPAARGALATLGLMIGYLWCETVGIFAALFIWLRHRQPDRFLQANFKLQCWWANTLKTLAERLYRLRFRVSGEAALAPGPAIMLPRHASIADTIIPMVYFAIPQQLQLRYVLKKELLMDPCLDIVGNRLPNFFVARGGQDTEAARAGVAALIAGLQPNEGALLYPEGTRFSKDKRLALKRRYSDDTDMLAQLERWPSLLPPRLGGTLAALEANPGLDLVFCAHTGFEGSSHFSNLINGSWLGTEIQLRFWRVPYSQIPKDATDRREFLFAQWDVMQHNVAEMQNGAASG